MRRLWFAVQLTDIWAELWPAPAWLAAATAWHTWYALTGLTLTLLAITHRYWRRRDYHKNVCDTTALLIRRNWPANQPPLIAVVCEQPFTLPQILGQRRRTKHWGAPCHRLVLTVRGTIKRDELGEWAAGTYEFATPDITPSALAAHAWDITLTHAAMPSLVTAA